jgi:hypothetical protein
MASDSSGGKAVTHQVCISDIRYDLPAPFDDLTAVRVLPLLGVAIMVAISAIFE